MATSFTAGEFQKVCAQLLCASGEKFTTNSYEDHMVEGLNSSNMTTTMYALVIGTVLALVLFIAMAVAIRILKRGRRTLISRIDAAEMVELSTDLVTSVVSLSNTK